MPSMKLPLASFQRELASRTDKLNRSHALRIAKRMARASKERIALNFDRDVVLSTVSLSDMARLYQVRYDLIPLTVALTKELVKAAA